ncbi:MAG: VanZ family protein, partial [Candidatus Omnitrophica bacterium CG08_land_8_20_14_0_20_41_16]
FAYLTLALFFSRALKNTSLGISGIKIVIFTFIFAVFYGISDEFHQYFVPYRDASAFDVLIDGFGGFLGSLLYICLK